MEPQPSPPPSNSSSLTPQYIHNAMARYNQHEVNVTSIQLRSDIRIIENALAVKIDFSLSELQASNLLSAIKEHDIPVKFGVLTRIRDSIPQVKIADIASPPVGPQLRSDPSIEVSAVSSCTESSQSAVTPSAQPSNCGAQAAVNPVSNKNFVWSTLKIRNGIEAIIKRVKDLKGFLTQGLQHMAGNAIVAKAGVAFGPYAMKIRNGIEAIIKRVKDLKGFLTQSLQHWPSIALATIAAGAIAAKAGEAFGAYAMNNFSAKALVLNGLGSLLPVAVGTICVWAGSAFILKFREWLLKKEIASPFLGYNPQMAYDNPLAVGEKIDHVIITLASYYNLRKQGDKAIALVHQMFPDKLVDSRKGGPLALGTKTPELASLMKIESKESSEHLVARYTVWDKLFKMVWGEKRSLDRELSRYLGEVIDLKLNFCRLAANRGNRDKEEYTSTVARLIQNTLSSLVTKSTIDCIEKTIAYKFGGLTFARGVCKYASIGLFAVGTVNLLFGTRMLQSEMEKIMSFVGNFF